MYNIHLILKKKIVLIGYAGVGKSSVGEVLADIFRIPFIDLDNEIVKLENKSIDKIFKNKGELYFRKIEYECLINILNTSDSNIISLGGGTPCYYNTIEVLNSNDVVHTVFLKASINILTERLFNERRSRPIIKYLKDKKSLSEFIGKHLFERNLYYNKSNYIINTDNKSIDQIANLIKNKLT